MKKNVLIVCNKIRDSKDLKDILINDGLESEILTLEEYSLYRVVKINPKLILINNIFDSEFINKINISLKSDNFETKIPVFLILNNTLHKLDFSEFDLFDFIINPYKPEELLIRIKLLLEKSFIERKQKTVQYYTEQEEKSSYKYLFDSEKRYKKLFEESPISLWEEDISELMVLLNKKRKEGVVDIISYLNKAPEFIYECLSKLKVVNINRATLKLFAADSIDHLKKNLRKTFSLKTVEVFKQEIASMFNNEFNFRSETEYLDLKGNKFSAIIEFTNLENINTLLVSVIDINKIKITEKELRESKNRLKEAQQIGKMGSWMLDLKSYNIKLSDEAKKLLEIKIKNYSKDDILNRIHPDDRENFRLKFLDAIKSKKNSEFQFKVLTKNNKIRYLFGNYKTEFENGNPVVAFGIVQDITSQKEIQLKLHNSLQEAENNELMLKNILNTFKDGVYKCSSDFSIEYMNNPAKLKAGESLIGKKCYQEIFGLEEKCNWCSIGDIKENISCTCEFKNPKDKKLYKLKSVSLDDGSMLNILEDISSKEESERVMKNLITAVEHSVNMIVITNSIGLVEYANKKYREVTGFSKNEIINQLLPIHNLKKTPKKIIVDMNEKLLSGVEWKGEMNWEKKDGSFFCARISKTPIMQQGRINSIITILEDITEQKLFDRKMLRATVNAEEKERKKLAEDLHDQLGPYLSVIKLNINQLNDDQFKSGNREVVLQNLNEMIDNSISITRNISNSLMPNLLIDFGLINALESFIKKINTTQKITIDFKNNLNRDLKIQRNIEIIVYRILIELINNSLKHSKAENIKISFFDNKDLRIYYSDNGVGFNMQEKLKDKKGNGLFNILNRLNAINSKYQFKSEPNKGVHFKFEIKNK